MKIVLLVVGLPFIVLDSSCSDKGWDYSQGCTMLY